MTKMPSFEELKAMIERDKDIVAQPMDYIMKLVEIVGNVIITLEDLGNKP